MAKRSAIPKAPVARMLLNAGADRVSEDAIDVFAQILEQKAEEIAAKAVKISKHTGRKTIHDSDIKMALM